MLVKKEGISPIVATVLLIGFVIAIAVLIVLWGKGYIEELAEKRGILAEKQQQCQNVEISAVKPIEVSSVIETCNKGSFIDGEVVLKNKKEVIVNKIVFRFVGAEDEPAFESPISLKSLEVKPYKVSFPCQVSVTNVDAIPHLRVAAGHYVPCSEQSIRIKVIKF